MGTITVVLPGEDRWFFNELGAGAQQRGTQEGHDVRVCRAPAGDAAPTYAADCIEEAFAAEDSLGAIAAGFPYKGDGADRFLAWKRPLVIVGGSVLGFPVVSFDDVGVGRNATKHLLDLGHQRIAHLTGSLNPAHAPVFMRRRARGYRMTMESAGLTPHVVETEPRGQQLEDAVEALLHGPTPPTAVFAIYDEVAFTVMDIAKRLGMQPGRHVSIIGVNDHPEAESRGLTTIRHKPNEVGASAVEMILSGLPAGPGKNHSRLQPSTLVHRTSTTRLRVHEQRAAGLPGNSSTW